MPLGLNPQAKAYLLRKRQLDPNLFDINDDTGEIYYHNKTLPQTPTVESPEQTPALPASPTPKTSFLGGLSKGFASGILPTFGGAGGAAGLAKLGLQIPGPPLLKGIAALGGGVAGAIGGATLTDYIQNKLLPLSAVENLAQTEADQPFAYPAGRFLSSLAAFKPDPRAFFQAGKTGLKLLSNALPGRVATETLKAGEIANLANIGTGAGLGAAIPITQAISSGQPINPLEVAASTLGNALISNPNRLTQKLFGIQPNVRIKSTRDLIRETGLEGSTTPDKPLLRDIDLKAEGQEARELIKQGIIPPGYNVERKLVSPNPLASIEENILSPATRKVALNKLGLPKRYPKINEFGQVERDPKTGEVLYTDINIYRRGLPETGTTLRKLGEKQDLVVPYKSAEESAAAILAGNDPTISAYGRANVRAGGEAELAKFAEEARLREEKRTADYAKLVENEKAKRESNYQLFKQLMAGGKLGDAEKFAKELNEGMNFRSRYLREKSGATEDFTTQNLPPVKQKRLFQEQSDVSGLDLPAKTRLLKTAEQQKTTGNIRLTKPFYDIFSRVFGEKRNARVTSNRNLVETDRAGNPVIDPKTGKPKPVRGATDAVRRSLQARLIEINPQKATPDTLPHEFIEGFLKDLEGSPDKNDRKIATELFKSIENSEEYKAASKAFTDAGFTHLTPREFIAETTGYEVFKRAVNLDKQTGTLRQSFKDFVGRLKVKWGKASPEDWNNFIAKRFLEDPDFIDTHIKPMIGTTNFSVDDEKLYQPEIEKGGELEPYARKEKGTDTEERISIKPEDRETEGAGIKTEPKQEKEVLEDYNNLTDQEKLRYNSWLKTEPERRESIGMSRDIPDSVKERKVSEFYSQRRQREFEEKEYEKARQKEKDRRAKMTPEDIEREKRLNESYIEAERMQYEEDLADWKRRKRKAENKGEDFNEDRPTNPDGSENEPGISKRLYQGEEGGLAAKEEPVNAPKDLLDDYKFAFEDRTIFQDIKVGTKHVKKKFAGMYFPSEKVSHARPNDPATALHESVHAVNDRHKAELIEHIKSLNFSPDELRDIGRALSNQGESYAWIRDRLNKIADGSAYPALTTNPANIKKFTAEDIYHAFDEASAQFSDRRSPTKDDLIFENFVKKVAGDDVRDFLMVGSKQEKYYPKFADDKKIIKDTYQQKITELNNRDFELYGQQQDLLKKYKITEADTPPKELEDVDIQRRQIRARIDNLNKDLSKLRKQSPGRYYQPDVTSGLSEGQRKQVETPEFKKWFGKSKVVDENGEPLVVYHATGKDFTAFDPKKIGSNLDQGWMGRGFYFTDSKKIVNEYAKSGVAEKGSNIKPAFVSLKNPYYYGKKNFGTTGELYGDVSLPKDIRQAVLDRAEFKFKGGEPEFQHSKKLAQALRDELISRGHDGVIAEAFDSSGPTKEIVAFEPNQIKSAIGNQGTFDPNNPNILYQPSSVQGLDVKQIRSNINRVNTDPVFKKEGLIRKGFSEIRSRIPIFGSELDKFEIRNGASGRQLAPAIREALAIADNNEGRWLNPSLEALEKLSRADQQLVADTMLKEKRMGETFREELPNDKTKAVYDELRRILTDKQQDQIDAKQPVLEFVQGERGGFSIQPRDAKINPYYFPEVVGSKQLDILLNHEGSAAFEILKKDFIQHISEKYNLDADAAGKLFEEVKASYGGPLPGNINHFGAVRKAEGVGLPDSWLETDPRVLLRRYWRRTAQDRAWFDSVENDPNNLHVLGIKRDAWGEPVKPTDPKLTSIPAAAKPILDIINGANIQVTPKIDAMSRVANNLILGPVTGINDFVSALPVLSKFSPDFASLPGIYMKAISNIGQGIKDARTTGRIKRNISDIEETFFPAGEFTEKTRQLADGISKVTGRAAFENWARGLTMAGGSEIIRLHKEFANNGNKKSADFLTKLANNKDYNKLSDKELAARIVDLSQGTYDLRGLPAWVLNSPLAPIFRLAKWNIEQLNSLHKYAIQPATKGNFTPLLITLLGGSVGGLVSKELRELINNKKSNIPNFKEIANADPDEKIPASAYNLAAAISYSGVLGLLGEGIKSGFDVSYRNKPQGFNYPLVELSVETADNIAKAIQAVSSGEKMTDVGVEFAKAQFGRNIQVGRLAANYLGDKETQRKSQERRDLRVYNQLHNEPFAPMTLTTGLNPFENLGKKRFYKSTDRAEILQQSRDLVQQAIAENKGDPEGLQRSLRSLRVGGAATTLPSPERNPKAFADYIKYLEATYGKEEAQKRIKSFMKDRALGSFKRSLIPTL